MLEFWFFKYIYMYFVLLNMKCIQRIGYPIVVKLKYINHNLSNQIQNIVCDNKTRGNALKFAISKISNK